MMIITKLKISTIYLLSIAFVLLTACSDDNEDAVPELVVPASYPDDNFDANVTAERQVRTELVDLTAALNTAESNAANSTQTANISYPSNLRNVTLSSYASNIDTWLTELVSAANSGTPFDLDNAPMGEGGILGTRLLDENGLELEQMIEKGSFGAALYNHALSILNEGAMTAEKVDRLVEIFGANPTFPGDDSDPNNPDIFSAEYAERRSDNVNETGLYYDIRDQLILARTALADGRVEFQQVANDALNNFLDLWEQSNFATVIFYCNDARAKFAAANNEIDAEQKNILLGNALHSYAEGVAFAHGFLSIPNKRITDAQIQTILILLKAAPGDTPTSFEFAKDASTLTAFEDIIDLIQGVYGFTDEQVTGFFTNN